MTVAEQEREQQRQASAHQVERAVLHFFDAARERDLSEGKGLDEQGWRSVDDCILVVALSGIPTNDSGIRQCVYWLRRDRKQLERRGMKGAYEYRRRQRRGVRGEVPEPEPEPLAEAPALDDARLGELVAGWKQFGELVGATGEALLDSMKTRQELARLRAALAEGREEIDLYEEEVERLNTELAQRAGMSEEVAALKGQLASAEAAIRERDRRLSEQERELASLRPLAARREQIANVLRRLRVAAREMGIPDAELAIEQEER